MSRSASHNNDAFPTKSPALTVAVVDPECRGRPLVCAVELAQHCRSRECLPTRWLAMTGPGGAAAYRGYDTSVVFRGPAGWGKLLNFVTVNVRTPFVLWLTDGWRWGGDMDLPFCELAVRALSSERRFAQVKLHDDDDLSFSDRSIYSGPVLDVNGTPFFVQSPRKIRGGLGLRPAVTSLAALIRLGPFPEVADLTREDVDAEFCARSTRNEDALALRSPVLCPFLLDAGRSAGRRDIVLRSRPGV